jgi:hypothetical protein
MEDHTLFPSTAKLITQQIVRDLFKRQILKTVKETAAKEGVDEVDVWHRAFARFQFKGSDEGPGVDWATVSDAYMTWREEELKKNPAGGERG